MVSEMIGRYALIENGIVVRVTLSDPDFAAARGRIACPDEVGPGWLYDGTFSPPARDIDAEWAAIRARRNALLTETDPQMLPDRWAAMSPELREAWSAYRQALRAIPQTYADPQDVVWPVAP